MAMSLETAIRVVSEKTATSGSREVTDAYDVSSRTVWSDASGASGVTKEYSPGEVTLTGTALSYDLAGALTNGIGEAVVFGTVRVLHVSTPSTNAGTVTVYSGASVPWNTLLAGTINVPPNSQALMVTTSSPGWRVVTGTNDTLYLNGTLNDKVRLYLAGE